MKKHLPIILILVLATLLRVVSLDKFPAGLNADEAAIGYNAWSLLETGKDEHSVSWPTVFRSFDDYKPAVYFYLVLPFVKILGLNIWAVRLPSALLGVASVLLVYLIVKQLFVSVVKSSKKYKADNISVIPDLIGNPYQSLPIFSALLLAVSPWHLQFSRGGWEVNAALFFILFGLWGFFKGLEKPKYFYLFVLSLAVSLYTYHSARIISPILALSLVILYWRELFPSSILKIDSRTKTILSATLLGILVSIPLAGQLLSKEGQSRFTGVSVFSDTGPLWQALEMRREHPVLNLYVKAVHNQYLSYGLRFTKNYLSHFSPRFLFVTGDEIARSKVTGMGQSYLLLFPLLFFGLLSLLQLDSKEKKFVLIWFLVAPVAAAMTFQSPHALRAQNMVIPLSIIMGLGLLAIVSTINGFKIKPVSIILNFTIIAIGIFSVSQYLHLYYVHYPNELSFAWQYGFDQIAQYTKANYDKYDTIIISDRYDQPYILMAFFLKYPPQTLQSELVMTPRDKFGFSTVRKFGKYEFRSINYNEDKKLPNALIVAADESVDDGQVFHSVIDAGGKTMFKFISTAGE